MANASSSVVGATSSGRPVSFCPALRALASNSAARVIFSGAFIRLFPSTQSRFRPVCADRPAARQPLLRPRSVMNGTTPMLRRTMLAALCALPALLAGPSAQAKDDLVIGVAQFPSSLHPDIDPEVIKRLCAGFRHPADHRFDASWKTPACSAPSCRRMENGLAKLEDRPDGKSGMAVTIKLSPTSPGATAAGDGPRHRLHLEARPAIPQRASPTPIRWKPRHQRRCAGRPDRRPASRQVRLPLQPVGPHPARAYRGAGLSRRRGRPGDYTKQTAYNRAPTTPGLYNGPYHDHRL